MGRPVIGSDLGGAELMGDPGSAVAYVGSADRRRWVVWLGGVAMAVLAIWWVTGDADEALPVAQGAAESAPVELTYELEHTSWSRSAEADPQDDPDPVAIPLPPRAKELAARYQNADVIMGGGR